MAGKKENTAKTVTTAEVKPTKTKSRLTRFNRTGYLFVAPFVIVFLIFSVYPVFRTLYLSFCEYKGGIGKVPELIGLENYKLVLTDKFFWRALFNTARVWIINIILQLGLAFLLTIIFSDVKYKIRGLGIYRAVYYLPNLIAATSVAFLFKTLLDQNYGSFNIMLNELGFDKRIDWLGSSQYVYWTIAVIQAWLWFGNSFLMLMAGVMGISKDYFEAAAIDGAGRWTTFTKITMPLLKPIMLYVGVTSLIGGLQMFDLPQLMITKTMASYDAIETVVMYLYKFGFMTTTKDIGRAAAIAYVLFVIILIFSVLQFMLSYSKEDE